jgi:hypothetical protein
MFEVNSFFSTPSTEEIKIQLSVRRGTFSLYAVELPKYKKSAVIIQMPCGTVAKVLGVYEMDADLLNGYYHWKEELKSLMEGGY